MKIGFRAIGVSLSLALMSSCAPRAVSQPPRTAPRSDGTYHVVKPGENLFRISKAYDVPLAELTRINGLKDGGQIRIGQRILIPGASRQLPVDTLTPAENPPPATPEEVHDALLLPIHGTVNSGFGPRNGSFHDGVDIGAPEGTPIVAVEHGEVVYSDQLRGYGNIVILRHAGGMVSVYAHNQTNLVREGQQVARGEMIARVGSTGRVTGPHLHFEIRKNNAAQDPLLFLPQLCCAASSANLTPKD